MNHQTSNNDKPTGKENGLDHNTPGERPYDRRSPRTPRQRVAGPPRIVWTVCTAEGDVAEQLRRTQSRAIEEVLTWMAAQRRRCRSERMAPAQGEPAEAD